MDAVTGLTASTQADFGVPRSAKKTLGSEDFLKLLTVQLSNQDPMAPMKDMDFIAQMSSFTSLEQMQDLVDNFGQFSQQQQMGNAQSFLGREVTYLDANDDLATGVATALRTETGDDGKKAILLTVGNDEVPVTSVQGVSLPGSGV